MSLKIEDVLNVLRICTPHLIALAVIVVAAVVVMVLCRKQASSKKFLIRTQCGVAIVLALVIVLNLMCIGPLSSILNQVSNVGEVTAETAQECLDLADEITAEGYVMLENRDSTLPLASGAKLNVFGYTGTNPIYGGSTGSGVLMGGASMVSILDSLEMAGFQVNSELTEFYQNYDMARGEVGTWAVDWTLPEPSADSYSDSLMSNAKSFSDVALVVIGRSAAEDADLPTDMTTAQCSSNSDAYEEFTNGEHYLQLDHTERDLIDLVCSNFENVILVYNSGNTFEMGFVQDYPQIKGVIWALLPGQRGFTALGRILSGEVNPSGRTSDTWLYDLTASPAFNNWGDFPYDNMDEFAANNWFSSSVVTPHFVNYVESIYVGYKFYETAYAEAQAGNMNFDYDEIVQYPFGYGLSYTDFTQEMGPITESNGVISFDVTVTNTGSVEGKDVVQVYYNPPYTNGGIEKAAANLVAFDKTDLLAPGASQTITMTFDVEDMASYDAYGEGCYVLDAGEYGISIRNDAHTVIDEQTFTVDEQVVFGEENKRDSDVVAAVNQLQYVEGSVTYLSRTDGFANYAEATAVPTDFTMHDEQKAQFINISNYDATQYDDPNDVMPTTGANNGLHLADLRGLSKDDPTWETLLDQMSFDDMVTLIGKAGYSNAAIASIDKKAVSDCDGPMNISNLFSGSTTPSLPSPFALACTFNPDLGSKYGQMMGKMAGELDTSGWYAPAMNLHRTAFGGRCYEYYSEDAILTGTMGRNAVLGASEYGVYGFIKHFAVNEQETDRFNMMCTWANEQSIRELYLKPFEMAVKEGGAMAVMSSFNYVGPRWSGGSPALLQSILRGEWGFQGFVLSDFFPPEGCGYMNADQGVRSGNDACLAPLDMQENNVHDTSATSVIAMRNSCHNILYTVVNSRAYAPENLNPGLLLWQIIMIAVDVIIALAIVLFEVFVVRKGYQKRKSTNEKTAS